MRRWTSLALLFTGSGLLAAACLPEDTRPEPGSLRVTATGAPTILAGIPASEMLDGWEVAFDRFLLSLGRTELDDHDTGCTVYADGRYSRILDMRQPGAQKVSIIYALGSCPFEFRVSAPNEDAVLSSGVTAADRLFMRTPGSDPWFEQRGVSAYLEGSAHKGGVTKHFAWSFRQNIRYYDCRPGNTGIETFELRSGDAQTVDLGIHPELLFQDPVVGAGSLPGEPRLSFGRFADADDVYGNGDGEVSLDELAKVPLDLSPPDAGGDAGLDASFDGALDGGGELHSFGQYVVVGLMPLMVRYRDSGTCSLDATKAQQGDL